MTWSGSQLLASVRRLAAPAEEQAEWLKQLGTFPSLDELALEFDDDFSPIRNVPPDALRAQTFDALSALDSQLQSMSQSGKASNWQTSALIADLWSSVLGLADDAAIALAADLGDNP